MSLICRHECTIYTFDSRDTNNTIDTGYISPDTVMRGRGISHFLTATTGKGVKCQTTERKNGHTDSMTQ